MATILVEVEGLQAAISRNARLAEWKMGLHRPLAELLKQQHEHRVNESKTAPNGNRWAPLKDFTVAKKAAAGNANPTDILKDTDALSRSFRVSISGDIIRLRNPAQYTVFLQEGTTRMVARPFLGLSNPNVEEIRRLVVRHIESRIEME